LRGADRRLDNGVAQRRCSLVNGEMTAKMIYEGYTDDKRILALLILGLPDWIALLEKALVHSFSACLPSVPLNMFLIDFADF
jgi:hypothetical protein